MEAENRFTQTANLRKFFGYVLYFNVQHNNKRCQIKGTKLVPISLRRSLETFRLRRYAWSNRGNRLVLDRSFNVCIASVMFGEQKAKNQFIYYTQDVHWKTNTNHKLESETKNSIWYDKQKETHNSGSIIEIHWVHA